MLPLSKFEVLEEVNGTMIATMVYTNHVPRSFPFRELLNSALSSLSKECNICIRDPFGGILGLGKPDYTTSGSRFHYNCLI